MGKDFIKFPNGQQMPLVGLGMWQADDPKEIDAAVEKALDAGYRHFDTATLYKNEDGLGRAIKKYLDSGKLKREDLFIVTKLPWHAMSPDRVNRFLKSSLAKLQLDYVDLYLCHWPLAVKYINDEELAPLKDGRFLMDPTTDLEAVWKALEDQVDLGLAKSIGISNFTPSQIERIMKISRIAPVNHQIEVHAYFQNRELVQASEKHNISVCAYGPLGSPGRNSYNFNGLTYNVPPLFEDETVLKIAKNHNKTAAQVLLRFITQLGIAVIPKSTNAQRLQQNIDILKFELTPTEMEELKALDKGEVARSFPSLPGSE